MLFFDANYYIIVSNLILIIIFYELHNNKYKKLHLTYIITLIYIK
ncbi:protein of unknown function [Tenacibaculum aestuariivivum]